MVSFEFGKKKKNYLFLHRAQNNHYYSIYKSKFFKRDKPWTWELTPNDQTVGDFKLQPYPKERNQKNKNCYLTGLRRFLPYCNFASYSLYDFTPLSKASSPPPWPFRPQRFQLIFWTQNVFLSCRNHIVTKIQFHSEISDANSLAVLSTRVYCILALVCRWAQRFIVIELLGLSWSSV